MLFINIVLYNTLAAFTHCIVRIKLKIKTIVVRIGVYAAKFFRRNRDIRGSWTNYLYILCAVPLVRHAIVEPAGTPRKMTSYNSGNSISARRP